jgi:hypothetical protein
MGSSAEGSLLLNSEDVYITIFMNIENGPPHISAEQAFY